MGDGRGGERRSGERGKGAKSSLNITIALLLVSGVTWRFYATILELHSVLLQESLIYIARCQRALPSLALAFFLWTVP